MGLCQWFVLSACVSCCVIRALNAESLKEKTSEGDDSASFLGSLFGFRPCMDESCTSPWIPDVGTKISSRIITDEEYEPQHPDVLPPIPDAVVEHCLLLHTGTLDEISGMDKRHPGIKDVRMKVIEDLILYVSDFSVFGVKNCGPQTALLEFIRLAAEALKKDYAKECGEKCECTFTLGLEETEEFPDKGKTESPSTEKSVVDRSTSPAYVSTEESSELPCPLTTEKPHVTDSKVTTEPCPENTGSDSSEEIIAEDENSYDTPVLVGSIKGIPGVHYPNYTDVPITSFSCADKKYIPGFYADLETGCQVFHVCFEHRRESFLCPVGTIFNQPILACDYWYSSNCSLAQDYYEVNAKAEEAAEEGEMDIAVEEVINVLLEDKEKTEVSYKPESQEEIDIMKFLPVKAKVTEFAKPAVKGQQSVTTARPEVQDVDEVASQIFDKLVSSATRVVSKTRDVIEEIPEPDKIEFKPVSPISELEILSRLRPMLVAEKLAGAKLAAAKVAAVKTKVPVITKVKLAAAVPAVKLAAAKKAVPIAAKAKLAAAVPAVKLAAAKKAVPIAAKAKLVAAVPAAKVAAVKAAVPIAAKSKIIAAKIPVKVAAAKAVAPIAIKSKVIAASVPAKKVASKVIISGIAKAKLAAAVPKLSIPILKTKILAPPISAKTKIVVPMLKGKLFKAATAPVLKVKKLPLLKTKLAGSVPVVKAKLIKTAAISPLTKKMLALGYMKLLKAKKLALMG